MLFVSSTMQVDQTSSSKVSVYAELVAMESSLLVGFESSNGCFLSSKRHAAGPGAESKV